MSAAGALRSRRDAEHEDLIGDAPVDAGGLERAFRRLRRAAASTGGLTERNPITVASEREVHESLRAVRRALWVVAAAVVVLAAVILARVPP